MNPRVRTTLLFMLACWIWGSTWLGIKFGLNGVPPFVGASIRMLISGVLLVSYALIVRTKFPRGRAYVAHLLVQGSLLFGIQYALVYWSELSVPSGLVAVLFAINPLVTSLLAAVVFRIERLAPINVVGLVGGFLGVALIYWSEVISAEHAPALGALAVLAASCCASISTVFAKRYAADVPPLATVGPGQIIGGLVIGTIALVAERSQPVHFTPVSAAALAYLTIFGSGVAFLTYFTLVRTMSVTKLSLITYITPVIAVLLGLIFANEHLALTTVGGIAIVFAGIGLVHAKPHSAPAETQTAHAESR